MSTPRVGIGAYFWVGVNGSIRFRNLRVKKITDDPPDVNGDRAKAIAHYDRAIRDAPEIHDHYGTRGWLHFYEENHEKAAADLQHAVTHMPEEHRLRIFLGGSYIKTKDYEQGFRELELAHKHGGPKEWFQAYMLAHYLAVVPDDKYRDPERALKIIQGAVKLTGRTNTQCLVGEATALAALGRFDEALKLLDTVETMESSQPILDAVARLRSLFKDKKPDVLTHDD